MSRLTLDFDTLGRLAHRFLTPPVEPSAERIREMHVQERVGGLDVKIMMDSILRTRGEEEGYASIAEDVAGWMQEMGWWHDEEGVWFPSGSIHYLYVNQGWREGRILAALGNERLVEYVMPAGSSALYLFGTEPGMASRSISYPKLPLRWLRAVAEQGDRWVARPQSGVVEIGTPSEELMKRVNTRRS